MVRGNHTMLNGFWDYAIVSIPESGNGSKWRKSAAVLTRDEAVQAVKEAAIPKRSTARFWCRSPRNPRFPACIRRFTQTI